MDTKLLVVSMLINIGLIHGCGVSTHIEIAHRATEYFEDTSGGVNYKELILSHQDAFQAGNPYPDAYYDSICRGGKFHDVSEDTHWAPFMNATINYIRDKYPKPWDTATEKLVVFMLGFISHQVADISWHSLGIDQGFLDTMGKVNFYGSFEDAHSVGDPGGDVVAQFELDMAYIGMLSEWYVPVNDLLAIYTDYYGTSTRMERGVIEECTALLFLARLGEKLAMAKAFAYYGSESPFMVEDFQSYFLGGVDDMATWTTNVWKQAIYMLDEGTSACTIPHNPIYIKCPKEENPKIGNICPNQNKGFHTRLSYLQDLDLWDVNMTWTDRGVYFAPAQHIKERLLQLHKDKQRKMCSKKTDTRLNVKFSDKNANIRTILTSSNSYAKTGWCVVTSDVNQDGVPDLIIAAPGYGLTNKAQNGRVYVIYGTRNGIPAQVADKADLDRISNITLDGIQINGRFGMAVTTLDFNKDGLVDLVISAPSVGSPQLNYTGEVYIFLSAGHGTYSEQPDIIITCQMQYCNFGWSLASDVDFNGDGFHDLVIGSPYAHTPRGKQAGMVGIIYASTQWTGPIIISDMDMNATLYGDQEYGWFGYNLHTSAIPMFGPYLVITQPTYRICANPDCSYSKNDTQSVGRISLYSVTNLSSPRLAITGTKQFDKFGSMVAIGDPYQTGHSILAVGSDTEDVNGAIFQIRTNFPQAGQVKLYNLTKELTRKDGRPQEIAAFEGDRKLGRYGQMVGFDDVNGDQIDDLIIAAPLRINDISEELQKGEEGAVYIYSGGNRFPTGNVTRNCQALHPPVEPCPDKTASIAVSPKESGIRFGKNAVIWKQAQMTYLVVSAHNSNEGDRLAGAVYIYSITGLE